MRQACHKGHDRFGCRKVAATVFRRTVERGNGDPGPAGRLLETARRSLSSATKPGASSASTSAVFEPWRHCRAGRLSYCQRTPDAGGDPRPRRHLNRCRRFRELLARSSRNAAYRRTSARGGAVVPSAARSRLPGGCGPLLLSPVLSVPPTWALPIHVDLDTLSFLSTLA